MWSSRAKSRISRGLCYLLIGLLGACSSAPVDQGSLTRSQLAYSSSTGTRPIVATEAKVSAGGELYLTFLDGGQEVSVTGPLTASTPAVPATGDQSPPIVQFQEARHLPGQAAHGTPVSIRSIEAWQELIHQLEHEIAALVPGEGIVLDVLQQQDIFLHVDEQGSLQAIPLEQKPANIEPADTITLTSLLQQAGDRVRHSLRPHRANERYLLFNTGDFPDTGYPFVFMDLEDDRILFIQRWSDNSQLLGHGPAGTAQAVYHALSSQAKSVASRPLSSFVRLISSLGTTILDTIKPTPTWIIRSTPPPPLRHAEFMDPDDWESELDALVGNGTYGRIRYLVDGREFFPALIHAIKAAQASIRMRMYIFDNDDYAIKIADLLKARSRDVPIQLLLDGFGTISGGMASADYTPDHAPSGPLSIANYLRADSNIHVRMLSNPWMQGDHSKVILVDDRSAFLGGMNIGREYRYEWHDLMVETTGPVVDLLIRDFENTRAHSGLLGDLQAALQRSRHAIRKPGTDDYPLRLIHTKTGRSQILHSQIAAMRRARNRVWIQNAYLTSDTVLYELLKARRRGVDVRVIMPFRTDSGLISRSNALAANVMLRNGIRVYIYPGMSHLKAAIYDGWACLGSANFDRLSLRLNKETNIATSHPEAVKALADRVFSVDFEHAVELTEPLPAGWLDYLKEQIADHL